MKRLFPHRRPVVAQLAALLTILALLWQGVVPFVASTPRAQEVLAVICTEHGFQTLALPTGNSDAPATPQERPGKVNCPLCSGASSLDTCLPGGTPLQVAEAQSQPARSPDFALSAPSAPRYVLSLSRAPPVAV